MTTAPPIDDAMFNAYSISGLASPGHPTVSRISCVGELMILLHHHSSGEDFPNPTSLHEEWVKHLFDLGLVERTTPASALRSTQKGQAYIEAILSLPMPTQRWVMPPL